MSQDQWTAVDHYIADLMPPADPALDAALAGAGRRRACRRSMSRPNQGQLLHMLARALGARAILEIGTLGGYSTIWLARALPAGRPPDHAGGRPEARRGRARQHRPRRAGRRGRGAAGTGAGDAAAAGRRRAPGRSTWCSSTPTRPNIADYFDVGAAADPPRQPDHHRQRGAQRRGGRRRQHRRQRAGRAPLPRRAGRRAACHAPRCCRRWAARATTAWPSPSSPAIRRRRARQRVRCSICSQSPMSLP